MNRYLQEPAHCAICSIATVANYYNPELNYEIVRNFATKYVFNDIEDGLGTGQMGKLLNYLGFKNVTVISSDLNFLDYEWSKYSKRKLIETLKEIKDKVNEEYRSEARGFYKWLKNKEFDNKLIIDYNFGKYIRKHIRSKKPVIISFNFSLFFKLAKSNDKGEDDSIKGDWDEHAVVIYGCDEKGVNICDSHYESYKYRLKRYRKGFYRISWENLMSIIGFGDVILADNFNNVLDIIEK